MTPRLGLLVLAMGGVMALTEQARALLVENPPAHQEIAQAIAETYAPHEFGAAIIIARGEEVLLRSAVGQANIEHNVPMDAGMVFRIASITKQFTAAAILRLQDEGRLSVDDTIGMHLPGYPQHGAGITLQQLLNHTSGLSQHHTHGRDDISVDELLAEFAGAPLISEPGQEFAYNNNNYNVLGAIIERVTGQGYGDYLSTAFFDPLGMTGTQFDDPGLIMPGRVQGYQGRTALRNAPYESMSVPYAAGALVSTVDDLLTWNRALFGGNVLSTNALEQMLTAGAEVSMEGHDHGHHEGASGAYGFGLFIGEINGSTKYSHSGGLQGYGAYNLYIPDAELTVVVLQNSASYPHPTNLAECIAERLVAGTYCADWPR